MKASELEFSLSAEPNKKSIRDKKNYIIKNANEPEH
jgi:hypothetical protein